ncbi:acylphosphatase [Methylicorpusculum oleiharenae]|uniref:acylphosphatase n=1 Tax=Methylicorpusculum oleiharenae TaxID=1338687 RepID=UPI001358730C|nr:acylphosphatase [Methylicorpusculum oleiharenae]MCD2449639.1 acylphosphatase [Methylicorpusculum oleiharenae]
MLKQVRILVSGRVQGVYFRAFTQKKAKNLGITGYAKNLSDGRVEIVASGSEDAVDQLIKWCYKGPITARVDHVETESLNGEAIPPGFNVS